MLRRIVDMSATLYAGAGVAGEANAETVRRCAPRRLGAFGPRLDRKADAGDYRDRARRNTRPLYAGRSPIAVNTLAAADRIAPLDTASLRARRASYTTASRATARHPAVVLAYAVPGRCHHLALLGAACRAVARWRRRRPRAVD